MNIAFIPIDNRPVCYTLAQQTAELSDDLNLFLPKRELLGGLDTDCDVEAILKELETLQDIDVFIVSLDTIAYGGLIPSRRSFDTFEDIRNRLERFKKIIKGKKVYAFSSIMRISNNNVNEEEKEYWADYGKKIFEYSYEFHKSGKTDTDIPKVILDDYLNTRKRNFEINKLYLNWQKEGLFEKLVFSKDDCAEYGLNVMEAEELDRLSTDNPSVFIKTGADEIPLSLLSRAVTDWKNLKIKVSPLFLEDDCKNLVSNYEDISIENCVKSQLEFAGCEIVSYDEADVVLYVNNFRLHQGEIVMKTDTKHFDGEWKKPEKPYIIADIRFANGSDNAFVEKLLEVGLDENFLGYSAWNTSANTLGSLISCMIMTYGKKRREEFKTLQVTRFLDDWAYQANVRQVLEYPDDEECKELMKPYEDIIFKVFNTKYDIEYSFPWRRLFEIEIKCSKMSMFM